MRSLAVAGCGIRLGSARGWVLARVLRLALARVLALVLARVLALVLRLAWGRILTRVLALVLTRVPGLTCGRILLRRWLYLLLGRILLRLLLAGRSGRSERQRGLRGFGTRPIRLRPRRVRAAWPRAVRAHVRFPSPTRYPEPLPRADAGSFQSHNNPPGRHRDT